MIHVDDYTGTDQARVTAALAAAASAGGAAIYFDARTYALTARVTLPDVPLVLLGEGDGLTEIRWSCSGGGLLYEPTAIDGRELELHDLALTTTQTGGGNAIEATWPENTGTYGQTLTMVGCAVRGMTWEDAWTNGLKLSGARNAHIERTRVLGRASDNSNPSAAVMQSGIYVTSGESSCGVYLDRVRVNLAQSGLRIAESTAYGPEGIRVNGCDFVSVNRGVWCQTGEPLLYVGGGTNIAARYRCIESSAVCSSVADCHLELSDVNVSGNGGIYLVGACHDVEIHDCMIRGSSADSSDNGVVVTSGVTRCNIHHNNFHDFTSGILFNSGSHDNRADANAFENCTHDVYDNGTDNEV
jgi:hypothetical protein